MSRTAAPAVGSGLQQLCSRGDRRGLCPGTPTNSCTAGPEQSSFHCSHPDQHVWKACCQEKPRVGGAS